VNGFTLPYELGPTSKKMYVTGGPWTAPSSSNIVSKSGNLPHEPRATNVLHSPSSNPARREEFVRVYSWIALLLLLSPVAHADTADDARAEIERRGIPYEATALTKAAEEGDVEVVRLFLDAGPNADLRDYAWMTPLHNAALWSRAEVVELLLERGADPDLANSS
jgi:hypothetical protein